MVRQAVQNQRLPASNCTVNVPGPGSRTDRPGPGGGRDFAGERHRLQSRERPVRHLRGHAARSADRGHGGAPPAAAWPGGLIHAHAVDHEPRAGTSPAAHSFGWPATYSSKACCRESTRRSSTPGSNVSKRSIGSVPYRFSEPAQPSTARTGSAATHFTDSASATSRTPPHLGGRGPALTHTRVPVRTASSAGPSSSRYCAWSRSKARSSVTATVTGRPSKSVVTDAHLTCSSWDVAS